MKYFLSTLYISALLILAGCTTLYRPGSDNIQTGDVSRGNTTITGAVQQSGTELNDTTQLITVNLSDPKHSISFSLTSGEIVNIKIEQPITKTVVRVNQIIRPDGSMDGPFGPELTFTATQEGNHTFIIAVNQMASQDIFTGNVVVQVTKPYSTQ